MKGRSEGARGQHRVQDGREAMRPNYPGPEDSVSFHPVRNDTLLKGLRQGRDQIKFFPCQRTRRGSSGSMQPLPLPRDLPRAQREKQGWGKGAFALSPCKRSRTWPDQAPPTLQPLHTCGWEMLPPGNPASPAVPRPLEGIQGTQWRRGERARESPQIKGGRSGQAPC